MRSFTKRYTLPSGIQLFESRSCTSFNWNHIDLKSLTRMRSRYTVIQSYGVRYQISPNISCFILIFFLPRTFVFLFRNNEKFLIPVFIFRNFERFFNLNLSFRKPEGYLSSQEVADRSLCQGPEIQLELPNDIFAN